MTFKYSVLVGDDDNPVQLNSQIELNKENFFPTAFYELIGSIFSKNKFYFLSTVQNTLSNLETNAKLEISDETEFSIDMPSIWSPETLFELLLEEALDQYEIDPELLTKRKEIALNAFIIDSSQFIRKYNVSLLQSKLHISATQAKKAIDFANNLKETEMRNYLISKLILNLNRYVIVKASKKGDSKLVCLRCGTPILPKKKRCSHCFSSIESIEGEVFFGFKDNDQKPKEYFVFPVQHSQSNYLNARSAFFDKNKLKRFLLRYYKIEDDATHYDFVDGEKADQGVLHSVNIIHEGQVIYLTKTDAQTPVENPTIRNDLMLSDISTLFVNVFVSYKNIFAGKKYTFLTNKRIKDFINFIIVDNNIPMKHYDLYDDNTVLSSSLTLLDARMKNNTYLELKSNLSFVVEVKDKDALELFTVDEHMTTGAILKQIKKKHKLGKEYVLCEKGVIFPDREHLENIISSERKRLFVEHGYSLVIDFLGETRRIIVVKETTLKHILDNLKRGKSAKKLKLDVFLGEKSLKMNTPIKKLLKDDVVPDLIIKKKKSEAIEISITVLLDEPQTIKLKLLENETVSTVKEKLAEKLSKKDVSVDLLQNNTIVSDATPLSDLESSGKIDFIAMVN